MFLAVQALSFAVWFSFSANQEITLAHQVSPEIEVISDYTSAQSPAQPLSHVRFAARTQEKKITTVNGDTKKEIVSVLQKLPSQHTSALGQILLDFNPKAHRGLGGSNIVILRAVDMEKTEFFGVLIHEIGHSVDLGYLTASKGDKEPSAFLDGKKPVYEGDPSLDFYQISWENSETRKKTMSNTDFVSGYAMTDPFEDFAESYVYYILHNKDFKSLTQTSPALLQKYNFMKNTVFSGAEFDTGEYLTGKLTRRPWDITVIAYDLEGFMEES